MSCSINFSVADTALPDHMCQNGGKKKKKTISVDLIQWNKQNCIIRDPCDVIHVQLLRLLYCFILLFIILMRELSFRGVLCNMLIFSVNLQIQLIDVIFVNILPSPSDHILSIIPLLIDTINYYLSSSKRNHHWKGSSIRCFTRHTHFHCGCCIASVCKCV